MALALHKDDAPGAGDVHVDVPMGGARKKPKDASGVDIVKQGPAPLYVWRKLLNAPEVIAWAKAQGFKTTLPPEDMHVTVLYSKSPVDWMEMGETWSQHEDGTLAVSPGGPRQVAQFNQGAVVLQFACDALQWRNQTMLERGATSDWPEYHPHITLTYDLGEVDLSTVEPYRGPLKFGPEVFEEIKSPFDPGSLMEKRISTYFKVSGVDQGLGLVFGWGIVCKDENGADYRDTQNNHIPEAAMVEATTDFMKSQRVHGDMHERGTSAAMPAGMVVHSFPLTGEIAKAMGITTKKTGWMVATAPDPAMLAKFASGEYTGFSIGGEHIEIDGKPVAEAA